MSKLNLKDVTLFCIDDIAPAKALKTLESVTLNIEFGDVKLFSSTEKDINSLTRIDKSINSLHDYSVFAVQELHKYIDTEFAMCVQRDGYPINLEAWTDDFLKFDYIGAPWTWVPSTHRESDCPVGRCVGNGGFSIRSKRLMREAAQFPCEKDMNEDIFICRKIPSELEAKGIRFAPVELATFFSVENEMYTGQFGFHGRKTLELNKKLGIFG
tara:strand:- start:1615 stop:2253 length:639 start_codon:yes stop_codon:yes gene_type:complete